MAIFMWRNGALNVCESESKSPHWTLNDGIQCNPFDAWMDEAENAE